MWRESLLVVLSFILFLFISFFSMKSNRVSLISLQHPSLTMVSKWKRLLYMLERPLKDTQETLWTYKVTESTGSISFWVKVNCLRRICETHPSISYHRSSCARGHWGWVWAVPRAVRKLEVAWTHCNASACVTALNLVSGEAKLMLYCDLSWLAISY